MKPDDIHDERDINKIGLETYFFNFKFDSYSHSVDNLIAELEKELDESYQLYLQGKHVQHNRIDNWFFAHDSIRERLLAIAEMKIVYRFRNLEIDIKKLLRATYQVDVRDFHRWEKIQDFLKTKDILVTDLKNYHKIDQLRVANNLIKHSTNFEKGKSSIPEFKDLKELQHRELLDFYDRVKDSCDKFLISLSEKIYADLYEFDEVRLENMANKLALRMTKEQAVLYIEKIKSKY